MAEVGPSLSRPRRSPDVRSWLRHPWLTRSSLSFVALSLLALVIDLLMIVPPPEDRDGHHWEVFGRWSTSLTETVLLMTLAYSVLLVRRRLPLVVLTWMSALAFALTFSHQWAQPMVGPLVALFTAAAVLGRRPALLALVIGMAGLLGATWVKQTQWDSSPLAFVLFGMVAVIVWLLGRREHAASLRVDALRGQLVTREAEAVEEERRRIARELHDILAHSVSAMMMQAAGARAVTHRLVTDGADPRLGSVERALSTIETTGAQSMRELHRLLGTLREDAPSRIGQDDEPATTHTTLDLDQVVVLTRQSGLAVDVDVSGTPVPLDPSVRIAAYRVAQESLTNAMKHGGRGALVDVGLAWGADTLQLQVRCRCGHDSALSRSADAMVPPGGGAGLPGLRERVELVGGSFESGWVDQAFVTTAVLPLTPLPAAAREVLR